MVDYLKDALEAEAIYQKLKQTQNMCEIADIIEELDENMAKLVLKKFVYSR